MTKKSKSPKKRSGNENKWQPSRDDWLKLSERYELMFGGTRLMQAATNGNLDCFVNELSKDESKAESTSGRFGMTLLHFATRNLTHGREIASHLVFERKLDAERADAEGDSAISYAIDARNFAVADTLLRSLGYPGDLLHYVMMRMRSVHYAKLLLECNPNLLEGFSKNNDNLISEVAEKSSLEMVKWLIENGFQLVSNTTLKGVVKNIDHGVEILRFLYDEFRIDEDSTAPPLMQRALFHRNLPAAEELYKRFNLKVSEFNVNSLVTHNQFSGLQFVHEKDSELICKMGVDVLKCAARYADEKTNAWLWTLMDGGVLAESAKWNPLHDVSFNGAYGAKLAPFFVSKNFSLDEIAEGSEFTPAIQAIVNRNIEVARAMVQQGARFESGTQGPVKNLLHFCIVNNEFHDNDDAAKLRVLMTIHAANESLVRERNADGLSSVHLMAAHADTNAMNWLAGLEGVDIHEKTPEDGLSALHYAVRNKKHALDMVSYLVQIGQNLNGRSDSGLTPLHCALECKNTSIIVELITRGADVTVKLGDENLLFFCTYRNLLQSAAIVMAMDNNQLHEVTYGGATALHVAVRWADKDFCEMLIRRGIDVTKTDNFGLTAERCIPTRNDALRAFFKNLSPSSPDCEQEV